MCNNRISSSRSRDEKWTQLCENEEEEEERARWPAAAEIIFHICGIWCMSDSPSYGIRAGCYDYANAAKYKRFDIHFPKRTNFNSAQDVRPILRGASLRRSESESISSVLPPPSARVPHAHNSGQGIGSPNALPGRKNAIGTILRGDIHHSLSLLDLGLQRKVT